MKNLKKIYDNVNFFIGTKILNKFYFKLKSGEVRTISHRTSFADRGVIKQIFLKREYSIEKSKRRNDILDEYNAIISQNKIPLIIDAGANIGASAIWFHDQFPKSHIVAIEPNAENFKLLIKNTNGLDIETIEAAIGSTEGFVTLIDPGTGEWGYQTEEDPNGICKKISASKIINEKSDLGFVPFIIKIDIEGGEEELFHSETDWIDLFPLLIIELHDWLIPRQNTSLNFLKSISRFNRDFVYNSENIFSFKNKP